MIYKNYKKGYILLSTMIVMFFIILSIGTYIKYSTTITLQEFHKDLAKIRGYWAVYGSKELGNNITYKYYQLSNSNSLYDIKAIRNVTTIGMCPWCILLTDVDYHWSIINTQNSGIKDEMVFKRILSTRVLAGTEDYNITISYKN